MLVDALARRCHHGTPRAGSAESQPPPPARADEPALAPPQREGNPFTHVAILAGTNDMYMVHGERRRLRSARRVFVACLPRNSARPNVQRDFAPGAETGHQKIIDNLKTLHATAHHRGASTLALTVPQVRFCRQTVAYAGSSHCFPVRLLAFRNRCRYGSRRSTSWTHRTRRSRRGGMLSMSASRYLHSVISRRRHSEANRARCIRRRWLKKYAEEKASSPTSVRVVDVENARAPPARTIALRFRDCVWGAAHLIP